MFQQKRVAGTTDQSKRRGSRSRGGDSHEWGIPRSNGHGEPSECCCIHLPEAPDLFTQRPRGADYGFAAGVRVDERKELELRVTTFVDSPNLGGNLAVCAEDIQADHAPGDHFTEHQIAPRRWAEMPLRHRRRDADEQELQQDEKDRDEEENGRSPRRIP